MFFDFGHMRGQGKPADTALPARAPGRVVRPLRQGRRPVAVLEGVDDADPDLPEGTAPSGGPFTAPDWNAMHPGEVRFNAAAAADVSVDRRRPGVGQAIDPMAGGGDACATTASARPARAPRPTGCPR